MVEMVRGQRLLLAPAIVSQKLEIGMRLDLPGDQVFDVCCLALDATGRFTERRHLLYHAQRRGAEIPPGRDGETFYLNLEELPATAQRLVFMVAIQHPGTLIQLSRGYLSLRAPGGEIARFTFSGANFPTERAIVVAELYQKQGWRFAAVGQGFSGGLPALLAHFGAEKLLSELAPGLPNPMPRPAEPPFETPPSGGIYVNRFRLDEPGDRVLKHLGETTPLTARVEWMPASPSHLDGDLRFGYVLRRASGERGFMRADAGPAPAAGPASSRPLRLDLTEDLSEAQFVVWLSARNPDFTGVPVRVILQHPDAGEIELLTRYPVQRGRFCVLASLGRKGGRIEISKEERYFSAASEADACYGWGLQWSQGSDGFDRPLRS